MEYVTAGPEHIDGIHHVMQSTIRAVYPKYYPTEVVDFFCQLHSREHVQEGVESGNRDVLLDEGKIVGVGCADGNHITSVYVLPECQGQGFGSHILDCLEARIACEYETAVLDASLPAVMLYEHRGYKTRGHGVLDVDNDVKLVYEIMEIKDEETWKQKVDNAPGRVMVEFFVTWCPHCQREAPLLDEMAPAIREHGVEVYHANAEVMWTKGNVYGISETPSFILVDNGELIAKHEGFLTKDEILAFAEGKVDELTPSVEQSLSSIAFQ